VPREVKGALRKRGRLYYALIPLGDGRRREEATGTGDKREALAYLRRRVAEVTGGELPLGRLTVAAYSERWLPERMEAIRSGKDEERWLRLWILPRLGDRILEDLKPPDVAAWVRELREAGLGARSVRNAHGALVALLTHATFNGAILANPAKGLPRGVLPKIGRSKRPAFGRADVLVLLTDERIAWPRRVVYAIALFTGCRLGEAVGRRWRDLKDREPLRGLHIASQYDDRPLKGAGDEDTAERIAPVHPELEAVLDEWRRVGWERHHGRIPRPDDWIVPGDLEATRPLTRNQITKAHMRDRARVGLEVEPGAGMHSFRRSFVSLARNAGADRDLVAQVTHAPRGDVLDDSYTRREWEALCEVVGRIRLRRDEGAEVVRLPLVAAGNVGVNVGESEKASESPAFKPVLVEAQGIEGGSPLETPEKPTSGPAGPRARSSRFPGVRDPHPHGVGTPTFPPSDAVTRVAHEAGVDRGAAERVLRVVARELGVSERELAERLTGQRPTSDGGES